MHEPEPLLDAIAANPDDTAAWHVLADWLLEHDAPHAILAAYDLKLRDGTNDPDLLGDYATARRARHRLPRASGLAVDRATWRCGYVTRVTLRPRSGLSMSGVRQLLSAPQLSALSQLELEWRGPEQSGGLERALGVILGAAPPVTRHVALRVDDRPHGAPITRDQLRRLEQRPARATTLSLSLGRLSEPSGTLDALAAGGWPTLDLGGTAFEAGDVEALRLVALARPKTTFELGSTGLDWDAVRRLELPNVRWVPPRADAALVDDRTGAVYASVPGSEALTAGAVTLVRDLGGWLATTTSPHRRLKSGEQLRAGGGTWTFGEGPDLDAWYRDLVAARVPRAG